ncbi:MAG TPA: beta-ketoacyl synthase N-terminal-like domain-containing protein [Thermoanaerobaculia bacterium]|nr:beta-ketoacyl synthase N-terminal-like domain-containing protein [Thermoanaerobaculia bacterium]
MSSRRQVVVTGVGVVSPLGESLASLHDALCRGEGALAEIESFERDGLPSRVGAAITGFSETDHFGERNFRPLDRTGRLVAAAAGLALADAGWPATDRDRLFAGVEIGLVLGTTFGSVHTISEFDRRALTAGPNYVKPLDFANSVINAAAGQTAIWHDLTGVNTTLSGGHSVGLTAIAYAADLIATGRADVVLAGGAEELCYESFLGYARTGRTAGADGGEPCAVPFDVRRNGFALGEGSALLVLEAAEVVAARGGRWLASVAGHGAAFDPSRGRDGASAVTALARAVSGALADAGVAAADLAAVSMAANGSAEGDRREAHGVASALGEAARRLPVAALKGALGESLGAASAFQVAGLVATLGDGRLPGVAGLEEVEEGLGLAGLSADTRQADGRALLASALDLDGNARALVIARRDPARGAP